MPRPNYREQHGCWDCPQGFGLPGCWCCLKHGSCHRHGICDDHPSLKKKEPVKEMFEPFDGVRKDENRKPDAAGSTAGP